MFLDPALPYKDQEDRNQAVAFCALHSAQGSTMLHHSIKLGTVGYFFESVVDTTIKCKKLDLLKDKHMNKAHYIVNVLSKVKHYQSVPNLREPVTVKRVLCTHKKRG